MWECVSSQQEHGYDSVQYICTSIYVQYMHVHINIHIHTLYNVHVHKLVMWYILECVTVLVCACSQCSQQ